MMPLVYLDNCALQRPLDDRDQFRVRVEADAITAVLTAVEAGQVELATSAILRAEASLAQHPNRRDFIAHALALASVEAPLPNATSMSLIEYQRAGIKPFDAAHLAAAVALKADFFCSTDDRFLRKARKMNTGTTRVVTPLELAHALAL